MSVFLLTSSAVTTLLIAPADFQPGGPANGRALAFLAHRFLGDGFGTVYDLSTVAILWFAGASAMAGLLNLVPRYLPRYGMAPEWARASRPLTLVYMAVAFLVTIVFHADVDAQGGAYATGVLVLMTSAAVAVTLSVRRERKGWLHPAALAAALVAAVFAYTTVVNVIERPEGVKIAAMFIGAIVLLSLLSRVWRTTELRVGEIILDEAAQRFIKESVDQTGTLHILANHPHRCDEAEYDKEEQRGREVHNIPEDEPLLFLEIYVRDASEFSADLNVRGRGGERPPHPARGERRRAQRDRRAAAISARPRRQAAARVLPLGRAQSVPVPDPLPAQRPGGRGAAHARDFASGGA